MGISAIEWTGITWNPITGCDRVSAGCDNCYALTLAKRLQAMELQRITAGTLNPAKAKYQADGDPRTSGPGFGVTVHHDVLVEPLRWRKSRTVFVNSMSDLFHAGVPDEAIATVFVVMALTPRHTYQILTKRPTRMRALLNSGPRWQQLLGDALRRMVENADAKTSTADIDRVRDWIDAPATPDDELVPLGNVWLGTSTENQKWADIRIPQLLMAPAAVRFISAEPLLGPIDLTHIAWKGGGGTHLDVVNGQHGVPGLWAVPAKRLDWVIVGGESGGANARPMHPEWARSLRDQCQSAVVAFFFKQWGDWAPRGLGIGLFQPPERLIGPALDDMGHRQIMRRIGKHAAGRTLDERTWDQYPAVTR